MLTQWIQKIISMLLVMSAVLQVIPGKDYEKYIRFFLWTCPDPACTIPCCGVERTESRAVLSKGSVSAI